MVLGIRLSDWRCSIVNVCSNIAYGRTNVLSPQKYYYSTVGLDVQTHTHSLGMCVNYIN